MLTIVTLNLNYYFDKHGSWEVRKKLISNVLSAKHPHIVVLQAVAKHVDLYDGKDQALQLCEELSGYDAHYFVEAQRAENGIAQGSAVISKLPMIESSFTALNRISGLDDPNHRVLLKTTFDAPGGKLDIYNGHFSWVPEQAMENVEEAVALMKKGNAAALLAGDLNTPPESTAFQPLRDAGFVDAWRMLKGDEEGFTFEADRPTMRIDYFWASSALSSRLNSIDIIYPPVDSAARLSDHLGLRAAIS